jgi:alanyl-tRNA synthetase
MQSQIREAKKREKESASADLTTLLADVKRGLARHGQTLVGVFDLPALGSQALRDLCDRVKALGPDLAVGVFGREEGRVPYLVLCQGSARESGLEAGKLAKELAGLLGGGGGGRPDVAQGQGTKPEGVPAAIARLEAAFEAALGVRGAGARD